MTQRRVHQRCFLLFACIIASGIGLEVSAQAPSPGRDCGAELSGCMSNAWSRRDACISASSNQLTSDMAQCSRDHDERVARGANVIFSGMAFQDCIERAFDANSERLTNCASECANDIGRCLTEFAACLIENLIGFL